MNIILMIALFITSSQLFAMHQLETVETTPLLDVQAKAEIVTPKETYLGFDSIEDLVQDLRSNAHTYRMHSETDDEDCEYKISRAHDILVLLLEAQKNPELLLGYLHLIFYKAKSYENLRDKITPKLVAQIIKYLNINLEQREPGLNKRLLHQAAEHGAQNLVKTLCLAGAEVDALDDFGSTPLHLAAYHGHENVCKILLEHKASVNADKRYDRATPLHLSAHNGHDQICQMLIDAKADIDLRDTKYDGWKSRRFPHQTPLQLAAAQKHIAATVILELAQASQASSPKNNCEPVVSRVEKNSDAQTEKVATLKPLSNKTAIDNLTSSFKESCTIS